MRSEGFSRLLRQVTLLTRPQRAQLIAALRPAIGLDSVCETIERARPAPLCCPHCGNSRHYRYGVNRGLQRYRGGQTCSFLTGRAAVTARQLHRHLLPVLDPDVLLVTDGHAAYQAFARQARIAHAFVQLRLGERVRGAVHVQNVNAYHQRFRTWLSRFNGVASRYLPNYLGWRWALDGERIGSPEHLLRAAVGAFHT